MGISRINDKINKWRIYMTKSKSFEIKGSIPNHKSDRMKAVKAQLENAKKQLAEAQASNNAARAKKIEEIIENLTGTIERNQ